MNIQNNGNIDFSRVVFLGDSITAGYTDGALYYEGQQNSYPNLIAAQLKQITDFNFKQALLSPESVGIGFFGNSRLILKEVINHLGESIQEFSYLSQQGDLTAFLVNNYKTDGPFNNLGIPGATTTTLIAPTYGNPNNGVGNYNAFFTRIASNPLTTSILSDAMLIDPTFFSLFIGNNDVLAYALSGGIGYSITPLEGAVGVGFKETVNAIVNTLMSNGSKGVIADIPDLTSIPYFTAIPYNGLHLNSIQVQTLNQLYKHTDVVFKEGENPFLIADLESDVGFRQIQQGELILQDIFLDPLKDNYLKGMEPIPEKYLLTLSQVKLIQKTVQEYNIVIKTIAKEKGLAFVDLNGLLAKLHSDRVYDSSNYCLSFKSGGVFSLDGIHINLFGQALLANEFIKSINRTYSSNIPKLDLDTYEAKNVLKIYK